MFEKFRLTRQRQVLLKKKKVNSQPSGEKNKSAESLAARYSDPDSYAVFKKIAPGTTVLSSPLFILIAAIAVIFLLFYRWQLGLALFPGIALLYIVQTSVNRIRFRFFYTGWQKRLPFRLQGWDSLLRQKKLYCDLCWNDVKLEIELNESMRNNAELTGLIESALSIFLKKANRAFYDAEMGTADRRKKWTLAGKTSVTGSANPEVLGRIRAVCLRELKYIAASTGGIVAVRLTATSAEYEVAIEIPTSEGTAS